MILVLAGGMLLLGGCRAPSPVIPGWVQLSALTPLHPNQVMLVDLDRRLADLAAQRARLLERTELPLPPESIEQTLPALAEMPSPAAPILPDPPSLQPAHQQVLDDYRKRGAEIGKRLLIRQERLQVQRIAQQRKGDREQLDRQAEEQRRALLLKYRIPVQEATLRAELTEQAAVTAEQQAVARELQYQFAQQQYDDAEKQYRQATRQVTLPRAGSTAFPLSATAHTHMQEALTRMHQLESTLPSLKVRAKNYRIEADRTKAQLVASMKALKTQDDELNRQLQMLDQQKQQAVKAAEVGYALELLHESTLTARDINLRIERRIAERERQMQITPPQASAETEPVLSFPAQPSGTLSIEALAFRDAVGKADVKAYRARLEALQTIDTLTERLAQEQRILRETIVKDTRAAARDMAVQHGYTITFDQRAGKALTTEMCDWLRHYWPPS